MHQLDDSDSTQRAGTRQRGGRRVSGEAETEREARTRSLKGTHLSVDPRTGMYIWRRVNKRTGQRVTHHTGTKRLEDALKKAADYEEELRDSEAGLKAHARKCWRLEIEPLAEEYFEVLDEQVAKKKLTEKTAEQKKQQIRRALTDLSLRTVADLDDVEALERKIRELERQGTSPLTLRRCYQHPLQQFTERFLFPKKRLPYDPLATWPPIDVPEAEEDEDSTDRRASLPDEIARAFLAADRLHEFHGRSHPLRPVFLSLLVTAPRSGALISRDVTDLKLGTHPRIFFGKDVGKKRKGAGALDAATVAELTAYVADRTSGPLFLSPTGARLQKERLKDYWLEAYGLGLVDALWPKDEPKSFELVYLVNLALRSGTVSVSKGGNPSVVLETTRRGRSEQAEKVKRLVDRLTPTWQERMAGIDVHSFRMTHKSWAHACGVPPILIDMQLGWSSAARADVPVELMKLILGSATGNQNYLDTSSPELFDASRSAKAVRDLLDKALATVAHDRTSVLVASILASKSTSTVS